VSESVRPYTLVAELTYQCPLRCVYCSNPLDYGRHDRELDTATWLRVLREAEDLGVVQLNLTGGEPLVRDDLEALIAEARRLDLYTNLITSGIPLRRARLARFRELGLDNVQISVQDTVPAASDRIAGLRSFDRKLEIAGWVKELGFPLTLNTVLHRDNLDRVAEVVALAERLGADRLELANAQYVGWALTNRAALLPTPEQLERARSDFLNRPQAAQAFVAAGQQPLFRADELCAAGAEGCDMGLSGGMLPHFAVHGRGDQHPGLGVQRQGQAA